jgi:hypothetical protein
MTTPAICQCKRCTEAWRSVRTGAILLCVTAALLPPSRTQGMQSSSAFVVAGSQFHQRGPEDAGEARIYIQNTGEQPLSMTQLKVQILAEKAASPETPATECKCVYVKLSPPILAPGQYGEIAAKLLDQPTGDCHLMCNVSARAQAIPYATLLAEPALWISYVGFSQDLRRTFVYLENLGQEPAEAQLLRVGQFDVAGQAKAIHVPVPPKDKGCLIGDLPSPLTAGEFVHVIVAVNAGGRESKVHTVIRAIDVVPIVREGGTNDPRLGLDVQRPFLETMACPAHAHGTHELAAAKFLDGYVQQFSENPSKVIQIAVCRNDMPKAWYRFCDLPDVAVVNTCLRPPASYGRDPQKWFCPFFCVGDLAKRATEPGRFLAIIPTGPDVEDGSFLLKGLAPQEWRFLVCCAVASGAKGVVYRGLPATDSLSRDAFGQLNRELQHLKPFLSIAEPIGWITTKESNYAAKGLLCGDQAILVIIFDRRFFSQQKDGRFHTPPFGRAVTPVRVSGEIPQEITVREVATPFASLDHSCWDYRDGILELTADMVDSAQVYVISIQPRMNPLEGGLLQ